MQNHINYHSFSSIEIFKYVAKGVFEPRAPNYVGVEGIGRSVVVIFEVSVPELLNVSVVGVEIFCGEQTYYLPHWEEDVYQGKSHQHYCVGMNLASQLIIEDYLPEKSPEKSPVNQIRYSERQIS